MVVLDERCKHAGSVDITICAFGIRVFKRCEWKSTPESKTSHCWEQVCDARSGRCNLEDMKEEF